MQMTSCLSIFPCPAPDSDRKVNSGRRSTSHGVLTEQLGVSITDTFARQRAYAYFNDLRLADVACDNVAPPAIGP